MMKKLLTMIVVSFFAKAQAQVTLTIGEVYDYQTGDVFQYYLAEANTSPTYITDTITSKNLSGNSVTYGIKRYSYKLQSCQSCSPTITGTTTTATYTNLSSGFSYTNTSSCCTPSLSCYHDTLKATGYCSLPTYESVWLGPQDQSLSTCMKIDAGFSKGLGMTYEHRRSSNTPYDEKKQMIFYQKGTATCGRYVSVGLQENQLPASVSLFPNPASTILNIENKKTSYGYSQIAIINCLGETVLSLPYAQQLDISGLATGIYTLKLIANSGIVHSSKFVKVN